MGNYTCMDNEDIEQRILRICKNNKDFRCIQNLKLQLHFNLHQFENKNIFEQIYVVQVCDKHRKDQIL